MQKKRSSLLELASLAALVGVMGAVYYGATRRAADVLQLMPVQQLVVVILIPTGLITAGIVWITERLTGRVLAARFAFVLFVIWLIALLITFVRCNVIGVTPV